MSNLSFFSSHWGKPSIRMLNNVLPASIISMIRHRGASLHQIWSLGEALSSRCPRPAYPSEHECTERPKASSYRRWSAGECRREI
jgi:hypothetical protein